MKDVAGASVFLACKVEESGRKLRDVATVCQSKASGLPPNTSAGEPDPVRMLLETLRYLSYAKIDISGVTIGHCDLDENYHRIRGAVIRNIMF